jgi:general secretion pathway protein A
MYENFFHLQKSPFSMTPDPGCLFMTASHREALSGLLYAIFKRKGFVVLTGDAGTGKTTLLRALMRLSKSAQFSLVLNPTLNLSEFLEMVLLDFGISDVPPSKAQRIVKLGELLLRLHRLGQAPVLIVDEAHKLSPEVLEEIRLLTNFETADEKLIHIVLCGQPELAGLLNREDLRQLKQRIEIRLEIKPLSPSEVGIYMRHRWERAGATSVLPFTPEAVALIARAARGIPRLVNSICDNALLLGYGDGISSISVEQIQEVLRDLDLRDRVVERAAGETDHHKANGRPAEPHAIPKATATPMTIPTLERYSPPQSSPKPSLVMRLASKLSSGTLHLTGMTHE